RSLLLPVVWVGLFSAMLVASWLQTALAQQACTLSQITPVADVNYGTSINAAGTRITLRPHRTSPGAILTAIKRSSCLTPLPTPLRRSPTCPGTTNPVEPSALTARRLLYCTLQTRPPATPTTAPRSSSITTPREHPPAS